MFKRLTIKSGDAVTITQRRFRVKKKWANNRKTKSAADLALGHFDTYYPPVFGRRWPSMRVALLSQQKYCALVNNFADTDSTVTDLITSGADDIIKIAQEIAPSPHGTGSLLMNTAQDVGETNTKSIYESEDYSSRYGTASQEGEIPLYDPADIHQYMPVKRVLSEEDSLLETEVQQSIYEPAEIGVNVIEDSSNKLPFALKAFAYGRGEVDMFPSPSRDDTDKLAYYLLDAASILPVLALDVAPGDEVLDLCAAPGGKSLAILQTLLPGRLVCVDHSYSRMQRLRDVLRWYTPKTLRDEGRVETIHGNGIHFCNATELRFEKILVDVPCYADRHVVHEVDNNIFRRSRMKERLEIQTLQKELLTGALRLLKPGGTLVYSTCTLAMPQNDGTVHAALEDIWQKTNIDVAVVDTAPLADRFRDIFHFYDRCRFGQMVLPHLNSNFGPSYFCKLRRLN